MNIKINKPIPLKICDVNEEYELEERLNIEELMDQFEADTFFNSFDFTKDENGDYAEYGTFETFNGYCRCAINNNITQT